MTKQCPKCDEWKPRSKFYKDKSQYDGAMSACKECIKAYRKQMYWEYPEHHRSRKRVHYHNNLDAQRLRNRLKYHRRKDTNHDQETPRAYAKHKITNARTQRRRRCEQPPGCGQLKPEESFHHGGKQDNAICGVCAMRLPLGALKGDKRTTFKRLYAEHGIIKRKDTPS